VAEPYLEREDKFDVEPGFTLPELPAPDGTELRRAQHQLRSVYYDTADRALLRARMTLRRRSGSTDAGWQLKIPHAPAREEIRRPDAPVLPAELAGLLLGVGRGQPLLPVAVLDTTRTTLELLAGDGQRLCEIADDTVHASASGDGAVASAWREVEIELGPAGDERLLAELGSTLMAAGARRSAAASKLARALGVVDGDPAGAVPAYLLEQQRVMLAGDLALRRNDDTVIHKTRVAIRRFRSTLRVFCDRSATAGLDEELRWLAGVLGEVRDRQVMRRRLLGLVDELPDTEVLGPVRTRIEVTLDGELAEAWRRLSDVLTSERYLALLAAVDAFVAAIPAETDRAGLRKRMRRAERTVERRLRHTGGDPLRIHRARKAAKRARYAGELAGPVLGRKAVAQAGRNEGRQDLLGEHQDSVLTARLLLRLGQLAGSTAGENGFTFGLLYERELQRGAAIRAEL